MKLQNIFILGHPLYICLDKLVHTQKLASDKFNISRTKQTTGQLRKPHNRNFTTSNKNEKSNLTENSKKVTNKFLL